MEQDPSDLSNQEKSYYPVYKYKGSQYYFIINHFEHTETGEKIDYLPITEKDFQGFIIYNDWELKISA